MTKKELGYIVADLIDELRELPDGAETTSAQLLTNFGYELGEMDEGDLFEYHDALIRAAKANHITLDMSKRDGKLEGLPWNLEFVVRNKKAQIKCPYCGSTDTARILYGMPTFTTELQEKLDSGKIHIGGCCITGIRTEDGTMVQTDPDRYCNRCRKGFISPTLE